ncbi:MAG: 30S ribosome-binding factor RbfA [Verrucomicrobiales bacterium]|nr:30S ribosome-binding factor RbfA [Verrucomicrobiales bacterium]
MSQRTDRVGELLKREIGTCLERDFEFPDILVTVHHVDVAPNLRSAKVFVGVIGEELKREAAIAKLNHKRGFVQTQVTRRVVLKYTPKLEFVLDDSIERGVRVVNLLDEIGEIPDLEDVDKDADA